MSPSGGFNGDVTLSVMNLPFDVTAGFSTNPITGGSGSSTLTLDVAMNALLGTTTLGVEGASNGTTDSATFDLTIKKLFEEAVDFSVGVSPVSVTSGDFDGDGNLDLATADSGADTVSVLLQVP